MPMRRRPVAWVHTFASRDYWWDGLLSPGAGQTSVAELWRPHPALHRTPTSGVIYPTMAERSDIFLSYAWRDDQPFVQRLYRDLRADGYHPWMDKTDMPSRGRSLPREVIGKLDECDRIIAVMGPAAIKSEACQAEREYAFGKGKVLTAVLRLGEYKALPPELAKFFVPDFREPRPYKAALDELLRVLQDKPVPPGPLFDVPAAPPHLQHRPEELRLLREAITAAELRPVAITSTGHVAVHGMGGIGKTVLAAMVAKDYTVRRTFLDGVIWLTFGQHPDLRSKLQQAAAALRDNLAEYTSIPLARMRLSQALAGKECLLVLDDVWNEADTEPFIRAVDTNPRCRVLITTRNFGVVSALGAEAHRLDVMTDEQASELLAKWSGQPATTLPPEARAVVRECGNLPLAIAMIGAMVGRDSRRWENALYKLRTADLEKIRRTFPDYPYPDLMRAIEVSFEALGNPLRERYLDFAVFPEDTPVPEAVFGTFWAPLGWTLYEAQDALDEFVRLSLARRDDQGRLTVHDLQSDYVRKKTGAINLPTVHGRLVEAYRARCQDGWHTGPSDGYFLQNLCEHLRAAGKTDDAVTLLTGMPWIEAKCKAKLVFSLQDDYRRTVAALPEAQGGLQLARERQARLVRWAEEVTEYSRQWSDRHDRLAHGEAVGETEPRLPEPPLTCPMRTDKEIEAECRRIREAPTRFDRLTAFAGFVQSECYPLLQFGSLAGFALQHAMNYAPGGWVHDAASRLLPRCATPLLLRRWPKEADWNPKPAMLRTLEVRGDRVNSVDVTPDGRRAVSVPERGELGLGEDKALRVWDLESGACLRALGGHEAVESVSVTRDGRRAVSAGRWDNTLRVWDLESGACLRVLKGHTDHVHSVSVTPDGRRAVSGSGDSTGRGDRTLRVWDLGSGACLHTLEGHSYVVDSVNVTPDGRRAVSGSDSLRVWDVESGTCLRTLEGHSMVLDSVSVTPDGRRAVSGSRDHTVRVWDVESGTCLRTLEGHNGWVTSVSVTPDGRRAVSGSKDATLRVWDLESGACLRILHGHCKSVTSVSVMSDGRLAVSGSDDRTLRVWDLESGRCDCALEGYSGTVWGMSVTPDGQRAVSVGGSDTTLRIWDLESGRCERTVKEHIDDVPGAGVSVTRDGRRAVSWCHGDGALRVWDLESGRYEGTRGGGHSRDVSSVSVTPDGRRAVSGSRDWTLRVWDLESPRCLRILEGQRGEVTSVSVSPDGRRAVSGSCDKTLRVWDLESGVCLHTLMVLQGGVRQSLHADITPDGRPRCRGVTATRRYGCGTWRAGSACTRWKGTRRGSVASA